MMSNRTKPTKRIFAVVLAILMALALIPASILMAVAEEYAAGDACRDELCDGTLQWAENPEEEGMHYLICSNGLCVYHAFAEAYLAHEMGEGESDCGICYPPHVHGDFTYALQGEDTIVATCGGVGECDLADGSVALTIAAPAALTYDGTLKAATLSGAEEWEAVIGQSAPTIDYSAAPTVAGTYTASITVEDVTALVEFAIEKAEPTYTAPIGLTAEYGQTLADVVLPAGFAWVDETASVGAVGDNVFFATYTPVDTDNYLVVTDIEITVSVDKAPNSIAAPVIAGEATQTVITLEPVTPALGDGVVEYGYALTLDGEVTNWQESPVFEGLEGSTTYYFYARVSATASYTAAVSGASAIPTKDKDIGSIDLTMDGWIYGETAVAPEYTITGDYVTVGVEYAVKGSDQWTATVPTLAGDYTVRVFCAETPVWAAAIASCDFTIEKKEVKVEWGTTTFTYTANDQQPTATIIDGIVGADDVAVVVSGEGITVGEYTATIALVGDTAANYVLKDDETSVQFVIVAKEVVLQWTDTTLTHNANDQQPTATIVAGEICDGDVVGVKVNGTGKTPGEYSAVAELTGNDAANYVIVNAGCAFTISDLGTPENAYTMEAPNANGWYRNDVVIVPAEGFTIGLANDSDADFHPTLTVSESQEAYTVYLRNSDGYYTGAILVGDIHVDKTAPTVKVELNKDNAWEIFLNAITFGAYDRFFNTEQTVTVTAADAADVTAAGNSGIETVSYHVSNVGLSLDTVKALADDAWQSSTASSVSVTFNQNNDYVVYTKIVDKAGNVTYASSDGFVYDDIKPVITVAFDNNDAINESYFKADRTATIIITEHNFEADGVKLTITENGVDTTANYALKWDSEGDVHNAEVTLTNEADYTFAISCTDKAGNKNDGVLYDGVASEAFTIDKTDPNVSLTIEGQVKGAEKAWTETWSTVDGDGVRTSIDYNNRWSNSNVKVEAASTDNLSGIDYIEYFRTETMVTDLTAATIAWTTLADSGFLFEVAPNEKFMVYVHVVDKSGNEIYLSSNGVIVDDKAPGGDNYSPEIDITLPDTNANGFYNEDDTVQVDFTVVEPKYSGAANQVDTGIYSGIKEITYVIQAEDIGALEEGVFDLSNGSVVDNQNLIASWTGSIVIDKAKFNSNNVVVLITAVDNAGNVHTSATKIGDIQIDITAPTIDVTYDNNVADNDKYFKADRVATIVVTERNFNAEDVKITITNTDGVMPVISQWTKVAGTGNQDDTTWTATVTYAADGDYTFEIAYTDLADNVCDSVNYGDGVSPEEFTVDKTLPQVSVSYDNNAVSNGKFFAASRIATIVVREHNFDVNRVTFTRTAKLDGSTITLPAISWSHDGDVHIATIVYDQDGDYTFDVKVQDMAANDSEATAYSGEATKDFVVDQTINAPVIGGVADGAAYKNDVIPTISFSDVNYASYEVKLLRTCLGQKDIDVTEAFISAVTEQAQGGSGTYDTFEKIVANDGIYTLTVKMTDKAGNEAVQTTTFTVNRFGSVYEYSDALVALIKNGGQYVQKVNGDLVITEYNADQLLEGSLKILITRDGEIVTADYTSNPAEINAEVGIGDSGWYQYVYTIKASTFAKDGVYKISLTSKYAATDSPENESASIPENSIDEKGEAIVDAMNFTVDSVAPEIRNIVNLEKRIINATSVQVKYTLVDVGGLKSVEIIVNGKPVETITSFGDSIYNYSGKFTIKESPDAQTVQIRVVDLAGNVTDTSSKEFSTNDMYVFNDTVTVSTNIFVRWYANKALFWGSIAGAVVLAAAICFFVTTKKKKQDEEK